MKSINNSKPLTFNTFEVKEQFYLVLMLNAIIVIIKHFKKESFEIIKIVSLINNANE